MEYRPIANYGVIGDMHTAALVGLDGSIDWLCLPRFDSPSVFARILDAEKGGHFSISPVDDQAAARQFYWPDTNALVTRFLSEAGAVELTDFMPVGSAARPYRQLIRKVSGVRGSVRLRLACRPAFDYARANHECRLTSHGAEFVAATASLRLISPVPLTVDGDAATCDLVVNEGETLIFAIESAGEQGRESEGPRLLTAHEGERLFRQTVDYWRRWVSQCHYTGRWREIIIRSALALKLMTYEPTGAIIAAPTCSLPEELGGTRNWDYRYTWVRDAAFTVYAFLRLGFRSEAKAYMDFLARAGAQQRSDRPLQVLYGIDGRTTVDEQTLDHLDGYRGSKPVRIGNGAVSQLQMDIYGELLDAAYLFNKWGEPVSAAMWQTLRHIADWVCDNWRLADEGIWEIRADRRHFVYSKLMCWVAIDRALRLADKRSFPGDRARWLSTRDEIYAEILAKGWNPQVGAFTQSYGTDELDAANLMMPLVFFLAPSDPMMLSTLDAIMRPPSAGGLVSNSLVFRYNTSRGADGLPGDEGTFNICTFWLVEALTRAGKFDHRYLDEARLIFERMLGYANHLGLYAEETGPSGEALGNFPQAFTHLALISAAFNLDRSLGGGA
ncbi:MAG: glycoside hydrolase family 15 protein [Phycisphaeraceae bacterium]|nr:glycoside hydrolase family 15 protein [Phycisphaeraceae bacterium]